MAEEPRISRRNVELAAAVLDAFNRRDLDALDRLCTPDYEWFPAMAGAIGGESYRGRQGFEDYLSVVHEAWGELQVFADEYRDLGDRVLLFGRAAGTGKGSGVPVSAPLGMVIDIRDGKLWRSRSYLDHDAALRAVEDEPDPRASSRGEA